MLNFAKKKIVAHVYEPVDKDQVRVLVEEVAEKPNFPKKSESNLSTETLTGYEDAGLLHWLSETVWGRGQRVACPLELVRLQVSLELFKQNLIPSDQSFGSLIAREQPFNVEINLGPS